MLFYSFIAEPPIDLVALHESLNLVLGVGMEKAAADPPWQNSHNLILVAKVGHHSQGSSDDYTKWVIKSIDAAVKSLP